METIYPPKTLVLSTLIFIICGSSLICTAHHFWAHRLDFPVWNHGKKQVMSNVVNVFCLSSLTKKKTEKCSM